MEVEDVAEFSSKLESLLNKAEECHQDCNGFNCKLKKAALEALGKFDLGQFQLEEREVVSEGVEEAECAICFDTLKVGELVAELRCKHIFHSDCLSLWLGDAHFSCPLCRAEVQKKSATENNWYEMIWPIVLPPIVLPPLVLPIFCVVVACEHLICAAYLLAL